MKLSVFSRQGIGEGTRSCGGGMACNEDQKCCHHDDDWPNGENHAGCAPASGTCCGYTGCGAGYTCADNATGTCYPTCGSSYCIAGVCTTDQLCAPACGSSYCTGSDVCTTDGECVPACGSGYCARTEQCCSSSCYDPNKGEFCCDSNICSSDQTCGRDGTCQESSTSSSTSSSTTSSSTSSTTDSTSAETTTETTTDALAILQTAVPWAVQTDPAGACFVYSEFTSAYTTPAWYTSMPTNAQSYFSSVNAQNTAYCTAAAVNASSGHGHGAGLSPGAKGGIAMGSIAGVASLALLLTWLLKPAIFAGIVGTSATSAAAATAVQTAGTAATGHAAGATSAVHAGASTGWSGVAGQGAWSGVTGAGAPPPPVPPVHDVLLAPAVVGRSGQRRSNQTQTIPRRPIGAGPQMVQQNTGYMPWRPSGSELSSQSPYSEVSGEAMRGRMSPGSEVSGEAMRGRMSPGSELSEDAARLELENRGYNTRGYAGNRSELSEDAMRHEL